jgi:hypothetical protein
MNSGAIRPISKDDPMIDLKDVALRFDLAQAQLSARELAVAEDKAGRQGSLVGRLADFLFDTAAEKAADAARVKADDLRMEAIEAVGEVVVADAMRSLSTDPDAMRRRAAQVERLRAARDGERQALRIIALAETARDAFDDAAEACSSASSMELMDAFTTNKGISAMSSMSNSSARSSVEDAKEALSNLRNVVSSASEVNGRVDVPDDLLDLVLDFALDLPFDFLSWSNKSKLDAAEKQCEEAKGSIESLIEKLRYSLERVRKTCEREDEALEALDRPYIERSAEAVPASLRFAIPKSISV